MHSNPNDPQSVTTVAIELEPGWTFFKVANPQPEPRRIEILLRKTIEAWFAEHPTFVIKKATVITIRGEILGIHVWFDRADAEAPKNAGSVEFGIDIHDKIAVLHSKEYIEAVVTDALEILRGYADREDTLVVVNPRKVAVILDKQVNRGIVIPVTLIEQVVEGSMKERLQDWLGSPATPFYVLHIAGSWFSAST